MQFFELGGAESRVGYIHWLFSFYLTINMSQSAVGSPPKVCTPECFLVLTQSFLSERRRNGPVNER